MIKNEDNVTKMVIGSTNDVVLDLNGKEINSIGVNETSSDFNATHRIFEISGKMIINDSANSGGIYTGSKGQAIRVFENGKIIVNNGTISGRQSIYSSSDSTNSYIEINGGVFDSKLYQSIGVQDNCNNCSLIINNGTFINSINDTNAELTFGTIGDSKLIINNGNFTSNGVILSVIENNIGKVIINGGTFTSTGNTIRNGSGTININGGSFESTNSQTIYNAASGTININGEQATFDENDNYISGVYVHANINKHLVYNLGTININNGTFKNYYSSEYGSGCIADYGGTVNIYNGDFYSVKEANVLSINNSSKVRIYNGNYKVINNTNVYLYKGSVIINGGVFTSNDNSFGTITGSLSINGGTFNGYIQSWTTSGLSGNVINICGGTFTNTNNDISANDSNDVIKYKSNVVWTGKTSPTVSGSYPSTVSLDDSIVCPAE